MWYSNSYRRHLCDMHIDDWDDSFLSKFSPENYVENLKTAKVQNAMIYLQSHVGLCYFPTKVGVMHKAFLGKEDMMKRTVDLCHENGIAVSGYYSLNFNTREHDRHPDWRMIEEGGVSQRERGKAVPPQNIPEYYVPMIDVRRYGLVCPNNKDYRSFVYSQIEEMLSYFTLDGLFFDMPFWQHTCYCESCRERFKREEGRDFFFEEPKPASPEHILLLKKKYEWMGDFAASVTKCVKSINENVSVEFNFAAGSGGPSDKGCGEAVSDASDFVGGDLYGGIYNHSLACKFYKNITKNAPFDYMFSRCKPELCSHTLGKTEDELRLEVFMTAAHHGASMVIDAIDPVGTLDARAYERIGKVFGEHEEIEPYFKGDMVEDVAIYYGVKSGYKSPLFEIDSIKGCAGASRALLSAHIPYGVTGSFYRLEGYNALVISMLSDENEDYLRILEYVKNGGKIYFSGARHGRLIKALLQADVCSYSEQAPVYVAPKKEYESLMGEFNLDYPLPFNSHAPILSEDFSGNVIAKFVYPYTKISDARFASIHSNPPGIQTDSPAIVEGRYGKGRFIWSALPIEAIEMEEYRDIFLNLVRRLLGSYEPSFVTDAPEDVEITLFEDEDAAYVHAVHLLEKTVMPILPSFEVGIKARREASSVEILPECKGIQFSVKDGYLRFTVENMRIFSSYRIIYKK